MFRERPILLRDEASVHGKQSQEACSGDETEHAVAAKKHAVASMHQLNLQLQ